MADIRKNAPRPLNKLYGAKGPSPEQALAHAEATRKYNREYSHASSNQKTALERDNKAFHAAKSSAAAAPAEVKTNAPPPKKK